MVWYVIDALSYSNYMRKKTLFESTLHAVPLCPPTLFSVNIQPKSGIQQGIFLIASGFSSQHLE